MKGPDSVGARECPLLQPRMSMLTGEGMPPKKSRGEIMVFFTKGSRVRGSSGSSSSPLPFLLGGDLRPGRHAPDEQVAP